MICKADSCNLPAISHRSLCGDHYAKARFLEKVKKTDSCWLWSGGLITSGYPVFLIDSRRVLVHRYAYEQVYGAIPKGLVLDHVCHSRDFDCPGGATCPHRRCVRPSHLEPVTDAVNVLRGRGPSAEHAKQTACIRGHAFTPSNTHYLKTPRGKVARVCRKCKVIRETQRVRRLRMLRLGGVDALRAAGVRG